VTLAAVDSVHSGEIQLYRVTDAMHVLSMSKTVIYEQIRSGRLRSVKQGRSRLIPESAIRAYIALLEKEAEETAA
jgi:excisionase family DNA binding protein